jgi:hypothetical protein
LTQGNVKVSEILRVAWEQLLDFLDPVDGDGGLWLTLGIRLQ